MDVIWYGMDCGLVWCKANIIFLGIIRVVRTFVLPAAMILHCPAIKKSVQTHIHPSVCHLCKIHVRKGVIIILWVNNGTAYIR